MWLTDMLIILKNPVNNQFPDAHGFFVAPSFQTAFNVYACLFHKYLFNAFPFIPGQILYTFKAKQGIDPKKIKAGYLPGQLISMAAGFNREIHWQKSYRVFK